jgi:hypothetical protein
MTKVCEMCGSPAIGNGDNDGEDYMYCGYCHDHTTFVEDEEDPDTEDREFNDALLRADDKNKWLKENGI